MYLRQGKPHGRVNDFSAKEGREVVLAMLSDCLKQEYGKLKRQALAITGSAETAEDIVQGVLTETTASINRGHEIRDIGAWLTSAVRYKACKSLKETATLSLDDVPVCSDYKTPEKAAEQRKGCDAIYKAIYGLVSDQRNALLLSELRGMRSTEIAFTLERTPSAVRQLLTRARRNVRTAVGSDAA